MNQLTLKSFKIDKKNHQFLLLIINFFHLQLNATFVGLKKIKYN